MRQLALLLLLTATAHAQDAGTPPQVVPDAEVVAQRCVRHAADLERVRRQNAADPERLAKLEPVLQAKLDKCRADEQHKLDFARQMRPGKVPAATVVPDAAPPAQKPKGTLPPWRRPAK